MNGKTYLGKKIERNVFKLQKRIYQASQRGDTQAVHKLQRLLLNSWSAKCLAVRRVTQDNRGKNTAGVDGIKSLTPPQRLQHPIIKGWTDYYATVSSKEIFCQLAHLTFIKLKRWAKRRHPKKSWAGFTTNTGDGSWELGTLPPKAGFPCIVTKKHPSRGTSKCAALKAPMMAIGSTGQKDEAGNSVYRDGWRHYSNGKPESVLTVDCTFNLKTNWKLTTLSLNPEVEEMNTATGNSFMLIATG